MTGEREREGKKSRRAEGVECSETLPAGQLGRAGLGRLE